MSKDLLRLWLNWSEELAKLAVMNVQKDGGTVLTLGRQFSQIKLLGEIDVSVKDDPHLVETANRAQCSG